MKCNEGSTMNGFSILSSGNHNNTNTNPHSEQYPYMKPSFTSNTTSDGSKYWVNIFNINLAYKNGLSDEMYYNFDLYTGGFGATKGINANVSLILKCSGTDGATITPEFIVRNKNFKTLTDMFRVYIVQDTTNYVFNVSFYCAINLSGQSLKLFWNKKYNTWHNTSYYTTFDYGSASLITDTSFSPSGTLYSPYIISECRPQCKAVTTSNISTADQIWTQIIFGSSEYEIPTGVRNVNAMIIPKTGIYHVQLFVSYDKPTNTGKIATTQIYVNGSEKVKSIFNLFTADIALLILEYKGVLNEGDNITAYATQYSSQTLNILANKTYMTLEQI